MHPHKNPQLNRLQCYDDDDVDSSCCYDYDDDGGDGVDSAADSADSTSELLDGFACWASAKLVVDGSVWLAAGADVDVTGVAESVVGEAVVVG